MFDTTRKSKVTCRNKGSAAHESGDREAQSERAILQMNAKRETLKWGTEEGRTRSARESDGRRGDDEQLVVKQKKKTAEVDQSDMQAQGRNFHKESRAKSVT
jgi:hypothetical protein